MLADGSDRSVRLRYGRETGHAVYRRRNLTLSYSGEADLDGVKAAASEALGESNLTVRTGTNISTGDNTVTITMPGTKTVTTDEVSTCSTR